MVSMDVWAQRAGAIRLDPQQRTGVRHDGYVQVIESIVRFFMQFQDERGAIIDPYAGEEKQYSTPSFALAGALVAARAGAADLLEPAARALDRSLSALAVERDTPQRHADFFAPLVVLSYRLLKDRVEPQRATRWKTWLTAIDAEACYTDVLASRPPERIHNWNVVALAGEMLRLRDGLGASTEWIRRYLALQLERNFDPDTGLYRDPNCPLPYDLFPRYHLGYALADGYDGPYAATLRELLARGEWMSLLTQTGSGGIPPGWRSSEHLWNDAALVGLCEVAARRYTAAGQPVLAGAFKRAAGLAFRSLEWWLRPSGELHIVKNHMDPALGHGFERYSFHSNYGLYSAAMLATACLYGDDTVPEGVAPVDLGGFVVQYPQEFHRLVANAGGLTLALDLGADGHYDVTGVNSLRRLGAHPLLGPSSGIPAAPRYQVVEPPGEAVALGPAWQDAGGQWHSLAGLMPHGTRVEVLRQEPQHVEFTVTWEVRAGGVARVHSRYTLTPRQLNVHEAIEGAVGAVRAMFPFLLDDGRDRPVVTLEGGRMVRVECRGTVQRFAALQDDAVLWLGNRRLAFRNGFAGVAYAERHGREITYSIEYG
jgi:hypothetical protein